MTEREFGLAAIDEIIRDSVTGRERQSIRWESFTEQFIEAIRTAKVYVDCGAEYGFYVRLALKYGPSDIQIHAFEPEPERFGLLSDSLSMFKNVTVWQFALSSFRWSIKLTKPAAGYSASASMHESGEEMFVDTIALDDPLPDEPVDVVKMDIEGSEDLAFLGMARTLASKPMLFVEWHPPISYSARARTLQLLTDAGYALPPMQDCGRTVLCAA